MRVARLHGPGDIRVHDEAQPVPAAGEELVRIDSVGICGSDLHWFTEGSIGDARLTRPLVLGHEMAGTVASGPRSGLRVAVDPAVPCWHCAQCRNGNPNLCLNIVFAGHGHTDGGLREFIAWPADRLHPVPDQLSADVVAALEPLGVALHAMDLTHSRIGESIGIVGCGPIGLMMIELAWLSGASDVIAVEPLDHRREVARSLGATVVHPDAAEALVSEQTDGHGLDTVIEIAGTDAAVDTAIRICRAGARVVLAGIPDADSTTFAASPARRKGITFAMSRRMKDVYPRTIGLAASGRIDLGRLISHQFDLAEAVDAFTVAVNRTGNKTVVHPGGSSGSAPGSDGAPE
jgi:L-iditol 2-dehydrogenase